MGRGEVVVAQEAPAAVVTSRDGSGLPLPPLVPGGVREHARVLKELVPSTLGLLQDGLPISYLKFGPERLGARLAPRVAIVLTPQGAHDVLAGADGAMDKGGETFESFRELSPNVFNLGHEEWVPRKRALQPVFTKQRVSEYAAAMSSVVAEAGPQWAALGTLDVQEHTRRLTSEILGRALLGRELASHTDVLGRGFDLMTGHVLWRGAHVIKAPRWVPTPGVRRYRSAERDVLALCDEALTHARETGGEDAPLLRRLLEAADPVTGEPLTDDQRRNDLLTFLMAGHDTTATTLTYALWELARHPEWQDAVAEEALAVGRRELTPSDVENMPTTVRVIHEALRLCPPARDAVRMATRDVGVDGFRIPAGWIVLVSITTLHRDPAAWDSPDDFNPARWAEKSDRSRWQFLPFGGGQRKCIGDHFAMLEASIALASLVRDLVLSPIDDFVPEYAFTTHSAGPVRMKVSAR